jgi:D-sedoheptulose 7-phosphate isomerase
MPDFNNRIKELSLSLSEMQVSNNKILIDTSYGLNLSLALIEEIKNKKSNMYIIGNGGSSGIASHAANDFINMCNIKSYTFHDISVLTCLTNDYGYPSAYKKLLENFAISGDLLIAISSSGNSENILNAVKSFKLIDPSNKVITLSGFNNDNKLRKMGDLNYWINSTSYGIVEISHQFILHFFADSLYKK